MTLVWLSLVRVSDKGRRLWRGGGLSRCVTVTGFGNRGKGFPFQMVYSLVGCVGKGGGGGRESNIDERAG